MQTWGEDIFKLAIRNESLYHDSNDNGVRIVNFYPDMAVFFLIVI